MKTRKRELAKAGIFGSVDNPIVVKENDLKEIVETFPEIGKSPIKLGSHWSENKPRLGNVISVSYDPKTKTLSGEVEENETLSQAVEDGYYPDVSIGAKQRASDGKMYLHHLAYLGDEPPAVKDLVNDLDATLDDAEKQIAASDTSFTAFPEPSQTQLYLSDTPNPEFLETVKIDQTTEVEMNKEEIEAMQAENAQLKAEKEQAEKLLSDSNAKQHEAEKQALQKSAEGKITEPQMEALLNLADSFSEGKTIELSDTNGTKKSASPLSVLTGIFESIAPKVQEGVLNLSDTTELKPTKNLAHQMMGKV